VEHVLAVWLVFRQTWTYTGIR